MTRLARALTTTLLLGLPLSGRAQSLQLTISGDVPGDGLGSRVAGGGDLDLDGIPDLLARTRGDHAGGFAGSVRAYSGFGSAQLHAWTGDPSIYNSFGRSISFTGDVDADGIPDVIVGAEDHPNGRACVFSGSDGSLLRVCIGDAPDDKFYFVSGAGDVDADGRGDWIVGGPGHDGAGTNAGIARVLSGLDGSVLHVVQGTSSWDELGGAVTGIGDIDGDGHADLAVGASAASTASGPLSGRVSVFSGRTGALLLNWVGNHSFARFGGWVAAAGDVDGDGIPDVVIGASGDASTGQVRVFSGATGLVVREWTGASVDRAFGWYVAGLGDLDGDGHAEVGVLDLDWVAYVFSGRSGALAFVLGPGTLGNNALSIGGAGDVNGDGIADFLLGTSSGDGAGAVSVYSGGERRRAYCFGDGSGTTCPCGNAAGAAQGCANSSGAGGVLLSSGSTSLGSDDLVFTAEQLLPGQFALLFAGANALNGGAGLPFGDGLRCVGGDVRRLGVRSPSPSGVASWGPGLAGPEGWPTGTRCFQVWYRDPSPSAPCGTTFNLTHAIEIGYGF